MDMKREILSLLENNAKIGISEIALRLGISESKVEKSIKEFEKQKIILGYRTVVNWDLLDRDVVTALIEVRTSPQRGQGFDKIAKRIYSYPEVKDCSLVSGGFDLLIVLEGKTLKEVAMFVAKKVATLDYVLSTQTHFILKKYKSDGTIYEYKELDDREAVVL